MLGKLGSRGLTAAWLTIAAGVAFAQPQPQIEIDFVGAQQTVAVVPLSPLLWVVIALALAAIGAVMLRRSAHSGKFFGWLLLGLAAAASWPAIDRATIISDADALPPTIQLTTSPATLFISSAGTYTAQNTSGTTIKLTQIVLNNPGTLLFIAGGTTCTVNLILSPLSTCLVVIGTNS